MEEDRLRRHKEDFIRAIHTKKKIRIKFYSKEDSGSLERKCAPMDYGPSRRAREQKDKFHLWDYESDTGAHTLSLNPEQIQELEVLDESFDPGEFVTWNTKEKPWFISRNWGIYS